MDYESLPGYCKYVSNIEAVLHGIFVDHKIRFTQPFALNDPLEFNPILKVPCDYNEYTTFIIEGIQMPSTNLWYHIQLIESQVNDYGILSMTKNPVSFDMWSKYANGHKGFLVEFKDGFNLHPAFKSANGDAYPVKAVRYVEIFQIDLLTCSDEDGSISIPLFNELFFYSKAARWTSEKGYRLVRRLADLGKEHSKKSCGTYREPAEIYLGELPLDVIQSVTFGAQMGVTDKQFIVDACQGTGIQFLQCFIYRDVLDNTGLSPRIELLPLDDDPVSVAQVMTLQPQVPVTQKRAIKEKKQVALSSIDQLPYYSGFENLVEDMFQRGKDKKE